MKTVVPLSNCEHYEPLADAGVDEFYCGVIPYEWLRTYGVSIPINRREFLNNSNICTMSSMKIIARKVQKYKIPVKITFNSLAYNSVQYRMLENIIVRLMDIGFNTFIIADIGLIIYLREKGIDCRIHISGEAPAVNREAISFFNQFGVSRYVFPRKTSIKEMKSCINSVSGKGIEFESFILNENCVYVGAFCNTLHCDEMVSACFIPTMIRKIDEDSRKFDAAYRFISMINYQSNIQKRSNEPSNPDNYKLGDHGCGICHIKALMDIGITHLKIVGRGRNLETLIKDVTSVTSAVQLAGVQENKHLFISNIKDQYFSNKCPKAASFCYYPEDNNC